MDPSIFTDTELQVGTERSRKYQGTAKIDLDHISFHPDSSRAIDPKNVDRLRDIFRSEGCHRYEIQNHITGVIPRESLEAALRAAHKSPEDLLSTEPDNVPHLHFSPGQVICLHGQHRVRAGTETLPDWDRWWIVDLYVDDISPELRTALIEEYANERKPSDGEIYRKISQYKQEHNAHFQNRWWARLSSNKVRRLKQLHKNTRINCAFDALLPIPGLWAGMSIGKLAKVMALDSDEEVLNYLSHIRKFWVALVSSNTAQPELAALMKIDSHTVKKLELMAPGVAQKDARTVHGWTISGEVLGAFSATERSRMWDWMQQYDGLIPSLDTFFRDMDYLESCANAMKRLFPLSKENPTLRSSMSHHFMRPASPDDGCLVQISESQFERRPSTGRHRLELAYRQVWLYAMRHYPSMAKDPSGDDLLAKATNEKADERVVYDMATLAQKLGFASPHIEEIIEQSPDRQIASHCLLKARKPDHYDYSADDFERSVRRIVECFAAATPRERPLPSGSLMTFSATGKARRGLPSMQAQRHDRRFLFIDHLHTPARPTETVTTQFVRRSVYLAFFGNLSSPSPNAPVERRARPADVATPISPLFVADDASMGGTDPMIDHALSVTDVETRHGEGPSQGEPGVAHTVRSPREASAITAEQERLQQEVEHRAAVADQERLRKEAEDRAAAEAAEREEKERAAAITLEQERARQEAIEKAAEEAANAAERERLQREAEAAERFRLESEAEERTAEEERTLQERATALAHLEQGDEDVLAPPDAGLLERDSSTTQLDLPMDVPSMITQLRKGSDSPDQDQFPITEPSGLATQSFPEAAIGLHTVEAPTGDISPARTATAALEPIAEEAGDLSSRSSVITNSNHQRPLRDRSAERRRADKEKVANSKRAQLEIDNHFTQTRGESEDLYSNEPDEEATTPVDLLAEPPRSAEGPSEIPHQDRLQAADPASHASPASFDPSTRHLTQLEFHTIGADVPGWPGSDQSAHDDVPANLPSWPEPSSASAMPSLRRGRQPQNPATKASSQRHRKAPDPRHLPPPPRDLPADTIIFRVWRGGKWMEMERVTLDPDDPFHIERVAHRYERVEHAEFYDKNMHKIAAPQCLRVAQAEGTYSVFMMFPDGRFARTVTRAMVTAADDLSKASESGQGRKRAR